MSGFPLGPLDWLVLALYLAVIICVGLAAGRFTKTTQDYFFAGQRFSWWLAAVSCIATLVGSYSFAQYAEVGYRYGFCSMMAYTNDWFVLPMFLFGWLPIVYYSRVHSIPEYFERRFDRRTRIAVLISLQIYLVIFIGINLWTIGEVLHGLYPLGPWVEQVLGPLAHRWAGGWLVSTDASVALWAAIMASVTAVYMHSGGQNTVMLTDLVQGVFLVAIGLLVLGLGLAQVGGWQAFWEALPSANRQPMAPFNHPPGLNTVGDFWSDGIAGTMAFYMINQGILMRFLSVRSVREARWAMIVVVLVMMPLAAVAVGGAGWVGRAMITRGLLDPDEALPPQIQASLAQEVAAADTPAAKSLARERIVGKNIFLMVTRAISTAPGLFGLVIAAVVAAMLSSLDTYITAVASVAVNDIYRPLRPGLPDAQYLKAARRTAGFATVLGVALVPLFSQFDSIYQGLSFATSAINPPLVVVLLLGILWPRFTSPAAFWTIVLGAVATVGSLIKPSLILPISHGTSPEDGFPYLRALFGLLAASALAVVITLFDHSRWRSTQGSRTAFWSGLFGIMMVVFWCAPVLPEAGPPLPGWLLGPVGLALVMGLSLAAGWLVALWDTQPLSIPPAAMLLRGLESARRHYKGGPTSSRGAGRSVVLPVFHQALEPTPAVPDDGSEQVDSIPSHILVNHPENFVRLSSAWLARLEAEPGDLVYVTDARWWLGGFRSLHSRLGPVADEGDGLWASAWVIEHGHLLSDRHVRIEKIM